MIFHLLDGVQTHVHKTLTSFMAMSFPQVLMTAFPKRPKTTLHISRNIIFHGFSDLDMVCLHCPNLLGYFSSWVTKALQRSEGNIPQNPNLLNTPLFKLLAQDFAFGCSRGYGYVFFSPPDSASVFIVDKPSLSTSLVSSHRSMTTSTNSNHLYESNCYANGS